ncbi:MAG TPA: PEP-utilizing enzyme [Candidatus Saccharimonadales bacterium]|nr:PEP-utilizing enzyme [Candidatus Saccharimonadales bacterium]
MADDKLAQLLKTQKSLTEWLDDIQHKDAEAIRKEDNDKRERLKVLNEVIGLPFDKPTQFTAVELAEKSPAFTKYLSQHGQELCALRLIPRADGLPKLRMRGKTVAGAYEWFLEQNIEPAKYRADFIPHPPDYAWATIFVVNKNGIQGEIIWGGHHQLTQGFHDSKRPHIFRYDFAKWMISPSSVKALAHLKDLANFLHVADKSKQYQLKKQLGASFVNDFLEGYFETTDSSLGTWFIDYSPTLGKMYADMTITPPVAAGKKLISGLCACPGQASGKVRIVPSSGVDKDFPHGAVLVCAVTTPEFVPLMQKASAIVTDQGGILSHAAIVARELKKPCIVGTGNATKLLKNGQPVTVDAGAGTLSL